MRKSIKMKRIFTLLFLVVAVSFTNAQNTEKAKKLLDEVSAKMNTYKNMYVEF